MLDYRARQADQARKAILRGFAIAVQSKKDWFFKIETLANKWAQEANLLAEDDTVEEDVAEMIWDLKAAAHRIRAIDHEIWLRSPSLSERDIDFEKIRNDVLISLKHSKSSEFAIRLADLRDRVGVYISDGIVPLSLHQELVAELDSLAALEPKDFHPGTYGKVQDLIHPSLYPYIAKKTPIHPSATVPLLYDGRFTTSVVTENEYDGSIDHSSAYSWIPSIFAISDDGKAVRIDSYINGLGPREHYPSLYALIENVFLCLLPHFERTTDAPFLPRDTGSIERWKERATLRPRGDKSEWEELKKKQEKDKDAVIKRKEDEKAKFAADMLHDWQNRPLTVDTKDPSPATSFKGRSLKVIVKAASYILKPGQKYDGSWHLEGMPHERIASSAIYYYDTNDLVRDSGLGFRRIRREQEDFPPSDYTWDEHFWLHLLKPKAQDVKPSQDEDGDDNEGEGSESSKGTYDYPSDWDENSQHVYEGVVPTTHVAESRSKVGHGTGRVISFPNWLQHKVMGISHIEANMSSGAPPAIRKILCFFLIADEDDEGASVDKEENVVDNPDVRMKEEVGEEEDMYINITGDDTEDKDKKDDKDGNKDVDSDNEDHDDAEVNDEDNGNRDDDDDDEESYVDEEDRYTVQFGPGLTYTGVKGMHVLSTADVPDQRCRTNSLTLRVLLRIVCERLTGKFLPPELVELIVSADLEGITREMAERHRLEFMEDRRVKVAREEEIFEADYTLCEH